MKLIIHFVTISFLITSLCWLAIQSKKNRSSGGFDRNTIDSSSRLLEFDFPHHALHAIGISDSKLYFSNATGTKVYRLSFQSMSFDSVSTPFLARYSEIQLSERKIFWTTLDQPEIISFANLSHLGEGKKGQISTSGFNGYAAASKRVLLRSIDPLRKCHVIAVANESGILQINSDILVPQTDGIFSTDGMMHYCPKLFSFVYVFFYKNEYLRISEDAESFDTGNTIDTTTQVNLQVEEIRGNRMLASPAKPVNRLSTVSNQSLFIESNALANGEDPDSQKIMSKIVFHPRGERPRRLFALSDTLVVIYRKSLELYRVPSDLGTSDTTKTSTIASSKVKLIPNWRSALSRDL